MADITTTKKLVQIGQDAPQAMALGVEPGKVKIKVENDSVAHFVAITPAEAVQLGVGLIQLAAQAQQMQQAQQLQRIQPPIKGH